MKINSVCRDHLGCLFQEFPRFQVSLAVNAPPDLSTARLLCADKASNRKAHAVAVTVRTFTSN